MKVFYPLRSKIRRQAITSQTSFFNQEILLEICIHTLEKPQNDRDSNDMQILIQATQYMSFFKDLNKQHNSDMHIRCCQNMSLEQLKKDDVVFYKGQSGDKFYIVLKGRVAIYLPVLNDTTYKIELQEANQLGPGSYFGELALLNNHPRTATIICIEDTTFAVLNKESFKNILCIIGNLHQGDKIQFKEETIQTKFLQSIRLFQNFTKQTIRTLIYHFKTESYIKGQIIFTEKDPPNNFYIIKQGEVILSKTFDTLVRQDPYLINKARRKHQVSVLGANEIFGEIECIQGDNRHFTAECSSDNVVLYQMKAEDFLKRVILQNKNIEVNEFVNHYIQDKIEWRNKRITQIMNIIRMEKQQSLGQLDEVKKLEEIKKKKPKCNLSSLPQIDTTIFDFLAGKRHNTSTTHKSPPPQDRSYNLVESYEKSKLIHNLLSSKISECNRKSKERNISCHGPYFTTPKKCIKKLLESSGEKLTLPSPCIKQLTSPKLFEPLQNFFQSHSQIKQPENIKSYEFYKRLICRAKLKNSWVKQKKELQEADSLFSEQELQELNILQQKYQSESKIHQTQRRLKTTS